MGNNRIITCVVGLLVWASCASAAVITDTQSVSFTSAFNPAKNLSLASFDTSLGVLTSVTVEFWSSGQVLAKVDNDDAYNTGKAQAGIIREWSATGPGIPVAGDSVTIVSPIVDLGMDDGDGLLLDTSAPDGWDFGILSFTNDPAGSFNPLPLSLYETAGPGTVSFTVTPVKMINALDFVIDPAPDAWQQEVQDPRMTVTAKVTYTYIPEPVTALFLGIGSLLMARRRSA